MLTADCAPSIGGIGRHVDSLCTGLRNAGYEVHVFDVRRLLSYRFGKNILASLFMGRAVDRWIAEKRIDVLHVHGGPGGVLFLATRTDVPVVITANHTYLQQAGVPGQFWKRLLVHWERCGYLTADRVVCISPDTGEALTRTYGIRPATTSVAECGFDLTPWITADRETADRHRSRCVFIGRPQARKGWDLLQAAWLQIKREHPEAELHVVGFTAAPMEGVTYRGRLDDGALQELLGSSRLLLAPSRIEGFGLAAAEACVAGTPVVGFDVPGLRTTVQSGKTGVLVPIDTGHFAAAVVGLLRDEREWTLLHDGCRLARGRFDAAKETAAYEAVYAAVYSRS